MSLSQSSQSGATMFFFWSYFPLFITIFLFLKKKQEGFSLLSGLWSTGTTNILRLFCHAEARSIFDCSATCWDPSLVRMTKLSCLSGVLECAISLSYHVATLISFVC